MSAGAREAATHRPDGAIAYALQKDAIARSFVHIAPNLSQHHASSFTQLLPHVAQVGDEAKFGRPLMLLWGNDSHMYASTSFITKSSPSSYLPSWYKLCNPVCPQCHVPLVMGSTAMYKSRPRRARRQQRNAKSMHSTRTSLQCTLCQFQCTRTKPPSARAFPSVRHRNREQANILTGRISEPLFRTTLGAQVSSKPSVPSGNRAAVSTKTGKSHKALPISVIHSNEQSSARLALPPSAVCASKRTQSDNKAGLRALLQQKKEQDRQQKLAPSKPRSGGLADFLQQL